MIRSLFIGAAALAAAFSGTTPAATPMVEGVPTPTVEPVLPAGTVTLAFAGDMHFERHLLQHLKPGRMQTVSSLWRDADLVIANLETAITSGGVQQRKIYTFRAPARTIPALALAGVDVVSMANNHALDYGRTGLQDTLAAFPGNEIAAVGIGADRRSALTPYRVELPDSLGVGAPTPISIFAFATREMLAGLDWSAEPDRGGIVIWERHRAALLRAVRAEAEAGRVVVVYAHWGREGQQCPTSLQRQAATALEEAGARVIVGAHPHILQGIGRSAGGALVAYSLGNFIWYNSKGGLTGVLKVTLTAGEVTKADFTTARLSSRSSTRGLPVRSRESSAVFTTLARCADLTRP